MKKLSALSVICAALLAVSGAYAGPLADATSDTLWGIELGGYLDVSYTYDFNNPDDGSDAIGGRAFATDDDEIQLNAFQLYIDRLPEDVGEAGFRFDILAGEDASAIGDLWGTDDDISIYQAFISYIAPMGNGLTIDLGRFATWHGYEAIESPANDQFSRSLLFTYLQPYTHTGIRLTYPINDQWEVSGGMTQGWDVVDDNNDAWTFHGAVRWMPMENVYIQNSVAYGPEQDDNDSDYTLLYDLVATWQIDESWTVGANFDYESTEDLYNDDDVDVYGLGGYVRYDVNEDMYIAFRGEWIDVDEGFAYDNVVVPEDSEIWEITATLGYTITDGLMTRLEYRHDDADGDVFDDEDGKLTDTQDTIALEVIYAF
ncbi:MAG: porin [Candidatus Omnitrophica bacterium]|nr:porin [Candidatus Omnitrophota bacterium]